MVVRLVECRKFRFPLYDSTPEGKLDSPYVYFYFQLEKKKIPNSWRIKMWLYKCFWTIWSSLYYTSIKRSSIFGFSLSREDCRVPSEGSRIHGNTDVQPHWNSIFWNQAKQVKSCIMLIRWRLTIYSKDPIYVQKWHFLKIRCDSYVFLKTQFNIVGKEMRMQI